MPNMLPGRCGRTLCRNPEDVMSHIGFPFRCPGPKSYFWIKIVLLVASFCCATCWFGLDDATAQLFYWNWKGWCQIFHLTPFWGKSSKFTACKTSSTGCLRDYQGSKNAKWSVSYPAKTPDKNQQNLQRHQLMNQLNVFFHWKSWKWNYAPPCVYHFSCVRPETYVFLINWFIPSAPSSFCSLTRASITNVFFSKAAGSRVSLKFRFSVPDLCKMNKFYGKDLNPLQKFTCLWHDSLANVKEEFS